MSILTREDGVQFVMQAYRELLTYKKKSVVSQRVRSIAEQQGQFVRILKKEAGQYEAVFSRDSGYLLGESVKHYFNEAQNLIFCESLSHGTDILVVVVRAGSVYLDALVPVKNLSYELTPLLTKEQTYQVVISGNVPLKENGLNLPAELFSSFETLDEPLFSRLPTLKNLQLLPLPLALKAEHLTRQPIPIVLFIILVLLLITGVWSFFPKQSAQEQPKIAQIQTNPYNAFYQALSTPAPDKQLTELASTITKLYTLPGWTATKVSFNGVQYQIAVLSDGGTLRGLNTWAKENQFDYHLTSKEAELTIKSTLHARRKPHAIYPSKPIINLLVDQLDILLQGKHIVLTKISQHGKAQETMMTIMLKGVAPQLLVMIGQELKGLPLAINDIHFTVTPGALNGTINLSVWGSIT